MSRPIQADADSPWYRAPVVVELVWWHVAIFVPTVAFKFFFLRKTTLTVGAWSTLEALHPGMRRYVDVAVLLSADTLEVGVLIGLFYVLGRLILRIPSGALRFGTILASLIVMGANHFTVLAVANLLTWDTLSIGVSWAAKQPQVIWDTVDLKLIVGGLFALGWAYAFTVLPSRLPHAAGKSTGGVGALYRVALGTIAALTCVGILTLPGRSLKAPLGIGGYWSSAVITFFQWDAPSLERIDGDTAEAIHDDLHALAFPRGTSSEPQWLVTPPVAAKPPHILVVALETAPRAYYPILDDPSLAIMHRMSERAIVSDHHYAISPYTWWNIAGIVSGGYLVQQGRGVFDYGDVRFESLASILSRHGYDTTYIDSFLIEWARRTAFWERFGFARLLDNGDDAALRDDASFDAMATMERRSFQRALAAVDAAESHGRRAFVTVATTIGHYPWVARHGEENRPNREKIHAFAALFDELLGDLLRDLERRGLEDQIMIVVTGDHGLRTRWAFESLDEPVVHGDVAFNVPFLLYAPGVLASQVRIPYVTSHVDIAPTLLTLGGIEPDPGWIRHGDNLLDARLKDRVSFMLNTNLAPVSGFRFRGCHYTLSDLTGKVTVVPAAVEGETDCVTRGDRMSDAEVRSELEGVNRIAARTFEYYLRTHASGATPPN